MAFPGFVLLLLLISIIGLSETNVILALSLFLTFGPSRVIRAAVLAERQRDYVLAARCTGAGPFRIVVRHVAPNILPLVIVAASIAVGGAILAEAGLSFLGLGVPPPAVSWGRMIGLEGRLYFQAAPYMAIFPGLALTLTVFAFNMLGDSLRDVLDPRLRK